MAGTPAVVLLRLDREPREVILDGQSIDAGQLRYSSRDRLLWVRFENTSAPRELRVC